MKPLGRGPGQAIRGNETPLRNSRDHTAPQKWDGSRWTMGGSWAGVALDSGGPTTFVGWNPGATPPPTPAEGLPNPHPKKCASAREEFLESSKARADAYQPFVCGYATFSRSKTQGESQNLVFWALGNIAPRLIPPFDPKGKSNLPKIMRKPWFCGRF